MKRSIKEMIESSPALKSSTIAYSDNFMLVMGGILNIYGDLTEHDCEVIIASGKIRQIQFARAFNVSINTFELINNNLLVNENSPSLHVFLNGFGAINNLNCLEYLPNLKSLTVIYLNKNDWPAINKNLRLQKLGIGGVGVSLKGITKQSNLTELFISGQLEDLEEIGSLESLKKLTISELDLKSLEFLANQLSLRELHFFQGSVVNYEQLPSIVRLEKLTFFRVRNLTINKLMPINGMKHLKELKFDTQPELINLDWLKNKNIKTEIVNCQNFDK